MEPEKKHNSGISKKASIAMAGISAIAASSDFKAQIVIGVVVSVAIIAQGVLDWRK